MSGAMASVVSAAVRRGVEGTTTARQIRVKAIASVAVSMATIGSLISNPPRYANAAAIIANAMPTVKVATTSRVASERIPSTRARRATSQTTAMVMDAVTCGATPGLPSTPDPLEVRRERRFKAQAQRKKAERQEAVPEREDGQSLLEELPAFCGIEAARRDRDVEMRARGRHQMEYSGVRSRAMTIVECEVLLFDMDGTLVDSTAVVERHWGRWAALHGLGLAEILSVSHGRPTIETLRLVAPHLATADEAARLDAGEAEDPDGLRAVAGAGGVGGVSSAEPLGGRDVGGTRAGHEEARRCVVADPGRPRHLGRRPERET